MIRREMESTLASLLGKYPAVNVGPRQSGEMTLVRGVGGGYGQVAGCRHGFGVGKSSVFSSFFIIFIIFIYFYLLLYVFILYFNRCRNFAGVMSIDNYCGIPQNAHELFYKENKMTNACALSDTGIAEFTFEDGFEAVRRSMEPVTRPPENASRRSTIAGPVAAGNKPIPESIGDLL